MYRMSLAAVLLLAALPAAAQPILQTPPPPPPRAAKPAPAAKNLLVELQVSHLGKNHTHRVLIQDGTQSNSVLRDGAKGSALILNVLPRLLPDQAGVCTLQLQLEFTAKDSTAQVQDQFLARLDTEAVVVDGPDIRATVKVSEIAP